MKFLLKCASLFLCSMHLAFAAVNLNTASQQELETIKGIGKEKAKNIIEYRNQNGPFQSIQDLQNVKGFGEKSVEKLKNDLILNENENNHLNQNENKKENKQENKQENKKE